MRHLNTCLKILFLIGITCLLLQCKGRAQDNQKEKENEWVWLFDGSSTDEWQEVGKDSFPEKGWVVENDELIVLGRTEDSRGGRDIITKKQFANFDLQLECKLTEGANSGIKYFVIDNFPGQEGKFLGLEYQLIDDERHPDAQQGRDGNHTMGSLYDLIPAPEEKEVFPPNRWNKIRIMVDGSHVEHWLNGKKLLEYDRHSEEYRALVSISKYKDLQNFGEMNAGHILLQGHGNTVAFRNIKIQSW